MYSQYSVTYQDKKGGHCVCPWGDERDSHGMVDFPDIEGISTLNPCYWHLPEFLLAPPETKVTLLYVIVFNHI